MASIVVSGDTSGAITIAAPAVAGTNTLTLPASTGTLVVTGGAQTIEFAAGTVSAPSITTSGDTNTGIFFPAADTIAFTEGGAEAMRIDSSGNVGIGTSSPTNSLSINIPTSSTKGMSLNFNNASVASFTGNSSTGEIRIGGVAANWFPTFYAGTAEVGRFDTNGNLLVGKTAISNTTVGCENRADGSIWTTMSASTSGVSTLNVYSTGAGAYRFYVQMDGKISATNTTIAAISDQRLKENIQDIDVGLDAVMALKPRKFDWKTGKGKDIKNDRGFIAQEFQTVFPDMIEEWKDPAPEGEEPYKSVRADLIPVLVKAIQEQQQIINDLKARIETLEGAK